MSQEIQQLSVFLENRAGQLSEITKILSQNKINIRSLNIAEAQDYGIARLITKDAAKSRELLNEAGYVVNLTEVVAVAVPDRPGGLADVLCCLSDNEIDISYMYSSFGSRQGVAYMIFRVMDIDETKKALSKGNFVAASKEDLGII